MNITAFFDLDDTLYDRTDPYRQAFARFWDNRYPQLADEAAHRCHIRGNEVFGASETGHITMDEMYIYRHRNSFADVGLIITPAQALEFQALYQEMQGRIALSPVMEEILTCCTKTWGRPGLITNGGGAHQRAKVQQLGLGRWFDPELILISGECGAFKPDLLMFRMAEERAGRKPEQLLYVGDSYDADMESAGAAGWRTLWFNRRREAGGAYVPTWEVHSEQELLSWFRCAGTEKWP